MPARAQAITRHAAFSFAERAPSFQDMVLPRDGIPDGVLPALLYGLNAEPHFFWQFHSSLFASVLREIRVIVVLLLLLLPLVFVVFIRKQYQQ